MPGFQYNLSWPQAKALAAQGAYIRPWDSVDRWYFRTAFLWWVTPMDGVSFATRVVTSADFGLFHFLTDSWTTMWPDQQSCLTPNPEDPDEPLPPDPDPEVEPNVIGRQQYAYRIQGVIRQSDVGTIFGEFRKWVVRDVTTTVKLTGYSDGALLLNGHEIARPIGTASRVVVDHSFVQPARKGFRTAMRLLVPRVSTYSLEARWLV